MSSNSLVLAAAMAVSGAVIFLSFSRPRPFSATQLPENQTPTSPNRPLRSCLSSDERRRERGKNKKKKRVTFAEEVKVVEVTRSRPSIKKLVRRDKKLTTTEKPCRDEMLAVDQKIPANRVALYRGILRDRVHAHRMECFFW